MSKIIQLADTDGNVFPQMETQDLSALITNKKSWVEYANLYRSGRTYTFIMRVTGAMPANNWNIACEFSQAIAPTSLAGQYVQGNGDNMSKPIHTFIHPQAVHINMPTAMAYTSNYAIISATWVF